MTRVARINAAIQRGRGQVARVDGEAYTVQRLSPQISGSVLSSPPVIAGFPSRIVRVPKTKVEGEIFNLQAFAATCDARFLAIGDVCSEIAGDGGVYCVAQMRRTRETIWMRTEHVATVVRPTGQTEPDAAPITSSVPSLGWAGEARGSEETPVILVNGVYSLSTGNAAAPATIPIGLELFSRTSDAREPTISAPFVQRRFWAYIPLLPGFELQEQDVLIVDADDRYEILSLFSTGTTGLAGYVALTNKEA